MKIAFFSVGLALCSASLAHAQKVPDNNRVEPGVRVGRIFLGDTRTAVHRRLGKAQKTFALGPGLSSELWRSTKQYAPGKRDTLEIVYRNGLVVQIEVTNPIFRTADGLGLNNPDEEWEGVYGSPTVRDYGYIDRADQRYTD